MQGGSNEVCFILVQNLSQIGNIEQASVSCLSHLNHSLKHACSKGLDVPGKATTCF